MPLAGICAGGGEQSPSLPRLIWSVRISTWECDWNPNRALKRQSNSMQRKLAYHSHIEFDLRKIVACGMDVRRA